MDPRTGRADRRGVLARIMERRELAASPIYPAIVTGRARDGMIYGKRLDGSCIQRGGFDAGQQPGSIVNLYRGNLSTSRGLSRASTNLGGAAIAPTSATTFIAVESISPDTFEPGISYTVTVTGIGFYDGMTFSFLIPLSATVTVPTVNPDITITSASYVSATEYSLDIDVDAGASSIVDAPLGFE